METKESGANCTTTDEVSTLPGKRSTPRQFYRPELDVVRFMAFFLVFLSHNLPRIPSPHLGSLLGGFSHIFYAATDACIFGLSLFFSLSAFLICELLLRERYATGTVAVGRFYMRRILRIWPLYYAGLALGALFAFTPLGHRSSIVNLGWYIIFMGAWQTVVYGWLPNPMYVLWSISVEEQFYFFVPWIVKWFTRKALFSFCVVVLLASSIWVCHLSAEGAIADRIWADSIAQFQCFAAGMLLCLILNGRIPQISTRLRLCILACGAAAMIFAKYGPMNSDYLHIPQPSLWPYVSGYLLASFGSVMILFAFLGMNPKFFPGWAVALGRISFGLYVFHELAGILVSEALQAFTIPKYPMLALKICGTFGLTVLMANLSYRYIETPFLRKKAQLAVIESRPI